MKFGNFKLQIFRAYGAGNSSFIRDLKIFLKFFPFTHTGLPVQFTAMSREYVLKPYHAETKLQIDYARELNPQQLAAVTAPPGATGGGSWNQLWRQEAQRTWRPFTPTALSGTR